MADRVSMDTRALSSRPGITLATTTARETPTPPRAGKFGEVLSKTVVRSAESAMTMLPGSPVMALAVRSATGTAAASVPVGTGASPTAAASTSAAGPTASGTGTEMPGLDGSLQQSQDMNLYYLQVQEQVNQQNRSFTTISNVMKAQHDTVKNAIGNIR